MSTETSKATTQTWYRVSTTYFFGRIEAREVVKVTEKTVTYLSPRFDWKNNPLPPEERRENRQTVDSAWFPTETEAVECVRGLLTAKVASTQVAAGRAALALADFTAAHPEV
jgi:hypothetical protein